MHFSKLAAAVAALASLSAATISKEHPSHERSNGQSLNPRLTNVPLAARDLPIGTCNSGTPCANGACCSKTNLCGYSKDFCGSGCQHNCKYQDSGLPYHTNIDSPGEAKAQCGPYAAAGQQKCPLNVCCSEFGYCGSTKEFCAWKNKDDPLYPTCDTKYGGCGDVHRPSCGGGSSVDKRSIGYYESWANSDSRKCQKVAPEDLNLDGFTHMNFAFSFFDPSSFQIAPMDSNGASLYSRFTALKSKKPSLQTWISVGGWSFTDPGPTQTAFSEMTSTSGNRQKFISGLIKFMDTYGFDGVDLDWEYPGADDRGGKSQDTANYVSLAAELRAAFGTKYGISMTLPTSYWYLQHFDLLGIQKSVDWFNLMAYDLHGVWDAQSKFVGPYIAPHTNITEIDLGLDLLWRSGVDPAKVVMGQGWYGRSFTLKDPSCNKPNGICEFSGGAKAGPCSNAAGILDLEEIDDIITKNNVKPVHDETAAVKWITWDSDQWVSYDDDDTFKQKKDFANSRCLGGLMVWAMDQVDQTKPNGLGPASTVSVTPPQQSNANQMSADQLAGLTCKASACGAGCPPGTNAVTQMNGQPGQLSTTDRCPKKQYQTLCCLDGTQTGKCQWRGWKGVGLPCVSGCKDGETEVSQNTNNHDSKKKSQTCNGGLQSYCCAGFKPSLTKDQLEQDAGNFAKEAAEAAAAQAALDIAAKAFCRIAVPALLAPLELLEDLIPIAGEIADAIEVAATPAIIEGCVKGIEKEGKAEFKVFGKEHTLDINKPTSTDKDLPAPKKHDPPKESDDACEKPDKLRKRVGVQAKREDRDSDAFKALARAAGKPNEFWRTGQGWAIREAYPWAGNVIPNHYLLVVGIVSVKLTMEPIKDCRGNTVNQKNIYTRDYIAQSYEIRYDDNYQCVFGKYAFDVWHKAGLTWANMGPIDAKYQTLADIEQVAQTKADAMGQYHLVTNNCRVYTSNLYNALK
ncbi:hypothetical protein HO133_004160 [Letharia lupina]|uniref:chitinase n=1 Tax=Letharia lupina TaxID=560253 RepID=A0A8H6CAK1_9LECA|nr:uncharacterized protein HO133_004160 [Letharia lupina]KAF6219691.1 hypothetical protein HO133_004160 [Letharia lupina]